MWKEEKKILWSKRTTNVRELKMQQLIEFGFSELWILGGSFGEDVYSIIARFQV